MYLKKVTTPLGEMLLAASDTALEGAWFMGQKHFPSFSSAGGNLPLPEQDDTTCAILALAQAELLAFFDGSRSGFSVPLAPKGTSFQQRVWKVLSAIPYGESRTYGEVAALAGVEGAYRAAGSAIGRNPVSVFIPCHRVLGSGGRMTGYAGGLERKQYLLTLEGIEHSS